MNSHILLTFLFLILALTLSSQKPPHTSPTPIDKTFQTEIKFFLQHINQSQNYFWITLQGEFINQSHQHVLSELYTQIKLIKQFVDEFNQIKGHKRIMEKYEDMEMVQIHNFVIQRQGNDYDNKSNKENKNYTNNMQHFQEFKQNFNMLSMNLSSLGLNIVNKLKFQVYQSVHIAINTNNLLKNQQKMNLIAEFFDGFVQYQKDKQIKGFKLAYTEWAGKDYLSQLNEQDDQYKNIDKNQQNEHISEQIQNLAHHKASILCLKLNMQLKQIKSIHSSQQQYSSTDQQQQHHYQQQQYQHFANNSTKQHQQSQEELLFTYQQVLQMQNQLFQAEQYYFYNQIYKVQAVCQELEAFYEIIFNNLAHIQKNNSYNQIVPEMKIEHEPIVKNILLKPDLFKKDLSSYRRKLALKIKQSFEQSQSDPSSMITDDRFAKFLLALEIIEEKNDQTNKN